VLRVALPATEYPPLDLRPDLRLAAFTAAISVSACLLFGLFPAIRATSDRPLVTTREIRGGRRRGLDRALVASQIALSLVLLVASGVLLRTLANLRSQDTGYDRSRVLMFSVDAHLAGRKGNDVPAAYSRVLDELRAIPDALSVTVSAVRPVSDTYYFVDSVVAIGERTLPESRTVRVAYNVVGPGYFRTLGIPLLAGREFDERDRIGRPAVALVSQRMARHFSGNPVGQRIALSGGTPLEVVGIAGDVRYATVRDAPRDVVYLPLFQGDPKGMWYSPTFEIRYSGSAQAVLQYARDVVERVDPGLVLFRVRTLEQETEDSLARERLLAWFTSYFGGFAVLLACIGLYGLISYGVAQRTPEIGLRLALGAPVTAVRAMVVKDAAVIVLAGAGIGVAASLAAVRLVQHQLFGVAPNDPVALGGATVLLLALALLAAYLPARRASRIDPLTALRHE
jgi:predicted permease